MDVKIYGQVHCGTWSQYEAPVDYRKSLCGNATERWISTSPPRTVTFSERTSGLRLGFNHGSSPGFADPDTARRTRRATGGPIVPYEHFAVLPATTRCDKCSRGPARFAWLMAEPAGQEWVCAVEAGLVRLEKEWRAWEGIMEAKHAKRARITVDTAHHIHAGFDGPLDASRELQIPWWDPSCPRSLFVDEGFPDGACRLTVGHAGQCELGHAGQCELDEDDRWLRRGTTSHG